MNYEIWYIPQDDTVEIWYQVNMDTWVFEATGFYSPQYSHIPPYVWYDQAVYVGVI